MRTLDEISKDITLARSTNQDWESVIQPLYEEQNAVIKHNRNKYEDDNYTVKIDCTVHITHKATLFIFGHRHAGMWECVDEDSTCAHGGMSDSCTHFDRDIEEIEGDDGPSRIYVCVLCRVALEGDPDKEKLDD